MNISGLGPVTGYSSATSQMGDIGMKVLDKAIDTNEQMGANMVKMMEQSVNPNIGSNFDVSV